MPHHRVGVRDVEPARIAARRIERDPERFLEALREHARPRRLAASEQAAERPQDTGLALDHERVAVGRHPDQPRLRQAVGVQLDLESRGACGQASLGRLTTLGELSTDSGRARRGQIGRRDLDALARALAGVVGERARAGRLGGAAARGARARRPTAIAATVIPSIQPGYMVGMSVILSTRSPSAGSTH
jgi:hypothetical protein